MKELPNGEFHRVDPRHLFLAIVGACSFPMGERALFEELIGGPTTEADLRAYAQFVADMFLDGFRPRFRKKAGQAQTSGFLTIPSCGNIFERKARSSADRGGYNTWHAA